MKQKINEIMIVMNSIEYGFKNEKDENIIKVNPKIWEEDFHEFYYLQTPEELKQSKCGVCWDQVELERKLFQEDNISCKTYFIYMVDQDMLPSHTFLTFQENHKHYWFEHSWGIYRGIHEYESEKKLLRDVEEKFRREHNEVDQNAKLYLYQYQPPKEHITCEEFYKYIETQKLVEL